MMSRLRATIIMLFGVVMMGFLIGGSPVNADEDVGIVVNADEEMIIYTQTGCGHCEKVEEFIEENELEDEFIYKNISLDPSASEEFTEYLDERDIPLTERGVPTLVHGDNWFAGDKDIVAYIGEVFEIDVEEYGEDEAQEEDMTEIGEEKKPKWGILIGGGIFVLVFLGYGIFSSTNGQRKS